MVVLTGCGSLGELALPEMSAAEKTWQVLHAIDAVQTYDAARDPCFGEGTEFTQELIGANPDAATVVAWWAGLSFLHAHASSWLEDRSPRLAMVWQAVTIADVGYAVGNNHSIGIRIGAPNKKPRSVREGRAVCGP